jgi:hypothetical protein
MNVNVYLDKAKQVVSQNQTAFKIASGVLFLLLLIYMFTRSEPIVEVIASETLTVGESLNRYVEHSYTVIGFHATPIIGVVILGSIAYYLVHTYYALDAIEEGLVKNSFTTQLLLGENVLEFFKKLIVDIVVYATIFVLSVVLITVILVNFVPDVNLTFGVKYTHVGSFSVLTLLGILQLSGFFKGGYNIITEKLAGDGLVGDLLPIREKDMKKYPWSYWLVNTFNKDGFSRTYGYLPYDAIQNPLAMLTSYLIRWVGGQDYLKDSKYWWTVLLVMGILNNILFTLGLNRITLKVGGMTDKLCWIKDYGVLGLVYVLPEKAWAAIKKKE